MLKHVHNTLARRNSTTKTTATQPSNSIGGNGQAPKRPSSPAPSILSSCSSRSSGSIFYSSTPNTSAGSSSSSAYIDALTLSPCSSSTSSSGYSSTWSRRGTGTGTGHRRASISLSTGGDTESVSGLSLHHGPGPAGSRLSISSIGSSIDGSSSQKQGNVVPLRIYTDNGCLRPDIQYKTVLVTHTTTCRQIIGLILTKCKIRYKDPRLYGLAMELRIRAPNGADVETAVPLEDSAYPLRLQEYYPRGQARFSLKVHTADAKLVKVHDETELLGWQYKSILISEKTTAGELINILTRFTPPNIMGTGARLELEKTLQCRGTRFELQLQVNEAWSQTLRTSDLVISKLLSSTVNHNNSTRLILCRERPPLPPRPTSTISLYENVFNNISPTSSIASSSDSSSYSMPESDGSSSPSVSVRQGQGREPGRGSCPKCTAEYWMRRRSQSLSLSLGDSASTSGINCNEDEDEDALLLQAFELFNMSLLPEAVTASSGSNSNLNANARKNLARSYSNGIKYEFFV